MPEISRDNEFKVENTHIRELNTLISPNEVKDTFPASEISISTVAIGREAIKATMTTDKDSKLTVITGPCSIHDMDAALEYAHWVREKREKHAEHLEIVMRMYFEKPRTTIGWKGLINDPYLDQSYKINEGLLKARKLAVDITSLGVPVGTEILDTMTPQYFAGLVSWGAIGARTTESQLHRELASGLSFPVGFKNGTSGDVKVAVDAVNAASHAHSFLAITNEGNAAIATTAGNPDCHVILRGGTNGPNYSSTDIASTTSQLAEKGMTPVVMVDTSHGNSDKDFKKQIDVIRELARQIGYGNTALMGVMIESNLKEGSQSFNPGGSHEYGKSITDACVGLEETDEMLELLSAAVKTRSY